MKVKTTLIDFDGAVHRNIGKSGITITLDWKDKDKQNAETTIEYAATDHRVLATMIADLLKFAYEKFPDKGIAENAIHYFAKEEGMMIEPGIASFFYKDKRN